MNTYSLYSDYTPADLLAHRAMVFINYSVMSFKFTEFYSMGLPLFVPSPRFYRERGGFGSDRSSASIYYCGPGKDKAFTVDKAPASSHPYNPNLVRS